MGMSGVGGGGVAPGAFHAEMPAGPVTSDAVILRGRRVPQVNECLFLLGEGRGQRGVRASDKSWGWVVDPKVTRVFHGQGCVHHRELVKGWHLEVHHIEGKGGMGQA